MRTSLLFVPCFDALSACLYVLAQLLGILGALNAGECNLSRALLHYKLVDVLYNALVPGTLRFLL
jgi:hypothetical protein